MTIVRSYTLSGINALQRPVLNKLLKFVAFLGLSQLTMHEKKLNTNGKDASNKFQGCIVFFSLFLANNQQSCKEGLCIYKIVHFIEVSLIYQHYLPLRMQKAQQFLINNEKFVLKMFRPEKMYCSYIHLCIVHTYVQCTHSSYETKVENIYLSSLFIITVHINQ